MDRYHEYLGSVSRRFLARRELLNYENGLTVPDEHDVVCYRWEENQFPKIEDFINSYEARLPQIIQFSQGYEGSNEMHSLSADQLFAHSCTQQKRVVIKGPNDLRLSIPITVADTALVVKKQAGARAIRVHDTLSHITSNSNWREYYQLLVSFTEIIPVVFSSEDPQTISFTLEELQDLPVIDVYDENYLVANTLTPKGGMFGTPFVIPTYLPAPIDRATGIRGMSGTDFRDKLNLYKLRAHTELIQSLPLNDEIIILPSTLSETDDEEDDIYNYIKPEHWTLGRTPSVLSKKIAQLTKRFRKHKKDAPPELPPPRRGPSSVSDYNSDSLNGYPCQGGIKLKNRGRLPHIPNFDLNALQNDEAAQAQQGKTTPTTPYTSMAAAASQNSCDGNVESTKKKFPPPTAKKPFKRNSKWLSQDLQSSEYAIKDDSSCSASSDSDSDAYIYPERDPEYFQTMPVTKPTPEPKTPDNQARTMPTAMSLKKRRPVPPPKQLSPDCLQMIHNELSKTVSGNSSNPVSQRRKLSEGEPQSTSNDDCTSANSGKVTQASTRKGVSQITAMLSKSLFGEMQRKRSKNSVSSPEAESTSPTPMRETDAARDKPDEQLFLDSEDLYKIDPVIHTSSCKHKMHKNVTSPGAGCDSSLERRHGHAKALPARKYSDLSGRPPAPLPKSPGATSKWPSTNDLLDAATEESPQNSPKTPKSAGLMKTNHEDAEISQSVTHSERKALTLPPKHTMGTKWASTSDLLETTEPAPTKATRKKSAADVGQHLLLDRQNQLHLQQRQQELGSNRTASGAVSKELAAASGKKQHLFHDADLTERQKLKPTHKVKPLVPPKKPLQQAPLREPMASPAPERGAMHDDDAEDMYASMSSPAMLASLPDCRQDMSVSQVAVLLRGLSLDSHIESFQRNCIDGQILHVLFQQDEALQQEFAEQMNVSALNMLRMKIFIRDGWCPKE